MQLTAKAQFGVSP